MLTLILFKSNVIRYFCNGYIFEALYNINSNFRRATGYVKDIISGLYDTTLYYIK